MRLASGARRLDLSPAWFSWVGTTPPLDVVERIGVDAIHNHNLALANRFRAGIGLGPSNSALLQHARTIAAVRGGRVRTSGISTTARTMSTKCSMP